MDISLISKRPGEEGFIYTNDNNINIVPVNNLIHGIVNDDIPLLITTPNEPISISKIDINCFDQNVYLGDGFVNCFLRWLSLQSNKISIIDSASMLINNLIDEKSNKVKEIISTQHLILIPICTGNHWIIYFIIRSSENSFMLILMDSFFTVKRTQFTNTIFK